MKLTYQGESIEIEMERVETDDQDYTYYEILATDEAGHCAGDMTIENLEQFYDLRDAINLMIKAIEHTEK